MGIPTVATDMKILTVIHPTNIIVKIVAERSTKFSQLGAKIMARARMGQTSGSFRAQGNRVHERTTDRAGQDLVPWEVPTFQRKVDHGPVQS